MRIQPRILQMIVRVINRRLHPALAAFSASPQTFAAVPAERLGELGLPAGPAEIEAFLAAGLFSRPIPDKEALIKMYEEVRAGF